MQIPFYVLVFIIVIFTKCNSHNELNTLRNTRNQQYVFIKGITPKSEPAFLKVDYIQYLTGENAIEAAKKAGQADTSKSEDGLIQIGVLNDYFIVNDSFKIRRLPVSKDCKFELLTWLDRVNYSTNNSLEGLRKIYEDSPFLVTISNDSIVEIKEVFTP